MPYRDPQHKEEWEREHHEQRLARRRELRRIEAAREPIEVARPDVGSKEAALIWVPIVVGGVLGSYDPRLAMGVGALALLTAAIGRKGHALWVIGAIILIVGLIFRWTGDHSEIEEGQRGTNA